MTAFIDEFRGQYGVEPICRVLPIAPSTYHARAAVRRDPSLASPRARRDDALRGRIREIWSANRGLYGARKVWHALTQAGIDVARCTVERLMRDMGLQGVVRGRKIITTNPDAARPCPEDKVSRIFMADRPNKLWVSDFTYVPTWSGTVYVAFVIDVYARRIVGWRVSSSMTTEFVLDALEQRDPAEKSTWKQEFGASFGPRIAIFVHQVHRPPGRSRDRSVRRNRRRQL